MSADDHLGVQFTHTPDPYGGYHQVTARQGDYEVGWLRWHASDHESSTHRPGEITALGVAPQYQRQGVATGMYDHALGIDSGLTHSPSRTRAGEGFAEHVGGVIPPRRASGYLADMDAPPRKWAGR